jgi:hypothetical protein
VTLVALFVAREVEMWVTVDRRGALETEIVCAIAQLGGESQDC